ncbi:embryo defective [Forsythia ovata]|uniref:Embryo defective n=1 Tax=Forsythia ovata TaxID=205694 RepID=A0ABD1VJ73_9LAMI
MALKINSPAVFGLEVIKNWPSCNRQSSCMLSLKRNGICRASPKVQCIMKMFSGQWDEPGKLRFGHIIDKSRKLWDNAPQPVKSFPWKKASGNFIQLILGLVLAVVKYLSVPVFTITSISEMSYCAHEKKLYLVPLPFLVGVAVAGVLREAAVASSPSLKNAEVPWHLIAVAIFFTLLKLPGPYYPYWGRIFIPHFANGGLLRTLWFAFLWYKNPGKSSSTIAPDYVAHSQ